MTKPSLAGVNLKLKRADEQLALLKSNVDAHVLGPSGEPPGQIGEFDPKSGKYIIRYNLDPPPDDWGIVVSEISHHLRSVLDNLVWQVIDRRGNDPSTANAFPIELSKGGFDAAKKRGVLAGLEPEDIAFIEEGQPFQHGPHWNSRHLLALLKHLSNVDKHRRLHLGFVALTLQTQGGRRLPLFDGLNALIKNLPPDGESPAFRGLAGAVPVQDAEVQEWTFTAVGGDDPTEIARVSITKTGPSPKVEMQPNPAFDVSLTDAEQPVMLTDLNLIRNRVKQIIEHFRPLF